MEYAGNMEHQKKKTKILNFSHRWGRVTSDQEKKLPMAYCSWNTTKKQERVFKAVRKKPQVTYKLSPFK